MPFDPIYRIGELKNPARFQFEHVNCYSCGSASCSEFLLGEDDLTGKEGIFLYVRCKDCDLVYQNPRLTIDGIKEFYDSEYIAHRKKKNWGVLTPLFEWTMNKHDREKDKLVSRFVKVNENTELQIGRAHV